MNTTNNNAPKQPTLASCQFALRNILGMSDKTPIAVATDVPADFQLSLTLDGHNNVLIGRQAYFYGTAGMLLIGPWEWKWASLEEFVSKKPGYNFMLLRTKDFQKSTWSKELGYDTSTTYTLYDLTPLVDEHNAPAREAQAAKDAEDNRLTQAKARFTTWTNKNAAHFDAATLKGLIEQICPYTDVKMQDKALSPKFAATPDQKLWFIDTLYKKVSEVGSEDFGTYRRGDWNDTRGCAVLLRTGEEFQLFTLQNRLNYPCLWVYTPAPLPTAKPITGTNSALKVASQLSDSTKIAALMLGL